MIKEVEVFIRKDDIPTTFYECVCDQCGKKTGLFPNSDTNYIKKGIENYHNWLEKNDEHFCSNCKEDYIK